MKFRIAYTYISGIFFCIFMEYGFRFYSFLKSILVTDDSNFLLLLFCFNIGLLVPYIIGIYYTFQLTLNQFLSNKFYGKVPE